MYSLDFKYLTMSRRIFFTLIILIVVATYFLYWYKYFFIVVILYMWTLQVLRIKYLGLSWLQSLKAFFIGPLNDYWWKMWQKDAPKIK